MIRGIKITEVDHEDNPSPIAELRMDPSGAIILASGGPEVMWLMQGVHLHRQEMRMADELGREYGVAMPPAEEGASLITPMSGPSFFIALMVHFSRSPIIQVEPIED